MRERLDIDVTVNENTGGEDAEAFEQYLIDSFSMYREVDVTVTMAESTESEDR